MWRRPFIFWFTVAVCALCALPPAALSENVGGGESVGSLLLVPGDIYSGDETTAGPVDAEGAAAAFKLAQAAVEAGDVSLALQHACTAATLEPNHEQARRLLGYQRVGEHWAGGYAQRMLQSGHVWRRDFGWIKTDHADKWDSGLRPWGTNWISAQEDARRHAPIERGWTVRTDHFLITTNIDRAAAVDLAVRLETLYHVWRQLFGEFALSADDLRTRLEGKEASGYLRRPFRVIYHRSRDEYNAELASRQPKIAMTLGIYFDAQREAHFFAGEDQDPGTIAHEAVHQFFYESAPRPTKSLAATANVWAVEGAACYFESLVERPGPAGGKACTIGTPDAGRVPAARHRRVADNYYVPLAELSALGVMDLQGRSDIARLYSQSAGLATFFMEFREGVYRKPFRELLAAVYAGQDTPAKLAELAGRSFEELDRQYAEFMQLLPVTAVIAR